MRKALVFLLALCCSGCLGAGSGEGLTLGGDGLNIGPSQEVRDEIALSKAETDNALLKRESDTKLEQEKKDGEARRESLRRFAFVGGAVTVFVGIGFAGKLITPLAGQAVAALDTALELRRSRRMEVTVEMGPGGYRGHLLAEGYSQEEIAALVQETPALDGPRVAALQGRVGSQGMKVLDRVGELDSVLRSDVLDQGLSQ